MKTQLYFWAPLMQVHKKQLSLVDEYYKRTKFAFEDIEKEADEYAESLYRKGPACEDIDPGTAAELAFDAGLEMYETLSVIKSNHLLMAISLLYHVWEQQLIKFTTKEMQSDGIKFKKALRYEEVKKIFELHAVDITKTKAWKIIRELKFLVNTIKHGDGESAYKLRKIRPDFFELDDIVGTDTLKLHGAVLLDEYSLQVQDDDLYHYLEATKSFWDEMPERASSDADTIVNAINEIATRNIRGLVDVLLGLSSDEYEIVLKAVENMRNEEGSRSLNNFKS